MIYFNIPYEIQSVVKKESFKTGKSVRQIIIEKLWGETIEKNCSPALQNNLHKLDEIKTLKKNWNGNGANPIAKSVIKKIKILIIELDKQPQIFPTANDSIQIEYDGENNSYLELQVNKKRNISYYKIDKYGKEVSGVIPFSVQKINAFVEDFYG